MTIDEAIRILGVLAGEKSNLTPQERWEAQQLGIEALKRVKEGREYIQPWNWKRLLGETKK